MERDLENPRVLLDKIKKLDQASLEGDESLRAEALESARALCLRLEKPWDSILRFTYMEPTLLVSVKIALDLNVFPTLQEDGGMETAASLAVKLNMDVSFLGRILRHLATAGILSQQQPPSEAVEAPSCAVTSLAVTLASPSASGAIAYILETTFPFFGRIPAVLRDRSYALSVGPAGSLWKAASGTNAIYYNWLAANPERRAQFDGMVKGFAESRQPWTEIYPTERLLQDENDDDDGKSKPVLADVGGGGRHDIDEFRRKHPGATGRLVVQDKPEVLAPININAGIAKQTYDFFRPQPVHGAPAYFLHSVLHNWADAEAKEILRNLRPALRRGRNSKVLVMDVVIRDNGPSQLSCAIDMRMLWNFALVERSETEWRRLIAEAGLKVCDIWHPSRDGASIIEAEVSD